MVKNNIFLLFLILIWGFGCSSSDTDNAELNAQNRIPKEKMILILADVQITEAYIDDQRKSGVQVRDTSIIYFEKVFKKHDITPVEFESSLLYYKKDLVGMSDMYASVITRLNELKAKSEEILLEMKRDSAKLDSLNQLKKLRDSLVLIGDTLILTDTIPQIDTISSITENNIKY